MTGETPNSEPAIVAASAHVTPTLSIPYTEKGHGNGLKARHLKHITGTAIEDWTRIWGTAGEGALYHKACEQAPPPGFDLSAIGVFSGDALVGGVPCFASTLRLDLLFPSALRSIGRWLHRRNPKLLTSKIFGAGSPYSDELMLAYEGQNADERVRVLEEVLLALEHEGRQKEADLYCLKNVNDHDKSWADVTLRRHGYIRIASLPIAKFEVPRDEAAYFASLSFNMRRSLKRKLRKCSQIRVEFRRTAAGLEADLAALKDATRLRAEANYDVFEGVAPGFYGAVLENLGDNAQLVLYWRGELLLGFSLVLLEPGRLTEKYSGLRYPEALEFGIFFLIWMTLLRLCFARGIPILHAGETTYLTKIRLGCRLERSWIYARHAKPFWNRCLSLLSPLASLEAGDRELKSLGQKIYKNAS